MVKFTESLKEFLWKYHRDIIVPLMLGHLEYFTEEIQEEYIEWLNLRGK